MTQTVDVWGALLLVENVAIIAALVGWWIGRGK